jgi:hypothetical protein
VRASRECDDLGDVALEVLLEPVGILGELAAEAVPLAIADTALGVAHVAVGAGLANPGGVEGRVEAVAALVERHSIESKRGGSRIDCESGLRPGRVFWQSRRPGSRLLEDQASACASAADQHLATQLAGRIEQKSRASNG